MSSAVLPTVLITGASSGIGRGIAIYLAQQNKYKLALLDINKNGLKQTSSICIRENPPIKIKTVECDLVNIESIKSNIDDIAQTFGPLSVVVNNAGILYKPLIDSDIDTEKVKQLISVNLMAPIFVCSYSMPYLKKTKSIYPALSVSIINISSVLSTPRFTNPEFGIYCASKFGLRGFTDCLFTELRDFGIKVCHLMPAWTNTSMMDNHNKVETKRGNLDQIVIGQQALQPKDFGQTVNFILNTSINCVPREIMLFPQYNEYEKSELFLKAKNKQQQNYKSKL